MILKAITAASCAALLLCVPASAQRRRDQDAAYAARQSGQVMPLHQIEKQIVPRMAGCDYLGPEFDADSGVYRLKFMRGRSVIWLDVDGRTGQIVARSGY
ncbi:hypothetical protein [Sphingomonas nostoxanthinifaciens]|uniref:hypothetical protein n=1 Tax=Sphingomonas nostoxanthinifaciens TaxID=2872652 RepID=UPI001CC20A41|nr:hypothetical protein [Sphingomonas nostoxanthinifaciens]UAK23941.1 hypothetical protein K8P63_16500 [Sphingomonas nostoxanthinifaciens]